VQATGDDRVRPPSVRGSWPGRVALRSGWARAAARPYNDDLPEASLRLDRGSAGFLSACTGWLLDQGCTAVHSPPLMEGGTRVWRQAGFVEGRLLAMMERDLRRPPGSPGHPVRVGRDGDWEICAAIDHAAFPVAWRVGLLGLRDAAEATGSSRLLLVDEDGDPVGFAITGVSFQTAYLQRIAVHPDHRGKGIGRSLVQAAVAWAQRTQARTILLNTQTDNRSAAALYRSEGFVELREPLHVLHHPADRSREPT
jgi:ribosomal protein S18 acetylase RimI-like enzyme